MGGRGVGPGSGAAVGLGIAPDLRITFGGRDSRNQALGGHLSDRSAWLAEERFAWLEPLLQNEPKSVPWADDCQAVIGIIHVFQMG